MALQRWLLARGGVDTSRHEGHVMDMKWDNKDKWGRVRGRRVEGEGESDAAAKIKLGREEGQGE